MKKRITTLMTTLSLVAVVLGGCSKNKEPGESKDPNYHFKFQSVLVTDEEEKPLEFSYDIPFASLKFDKSGTEFNNDLALLSFAFTFSSYDKTIVNEMYGAFGFDNIINSEDYDKEETENSIKYTLGHKKVNDTDVIALSLNGVGYKLPWKNNLVIGKTGNHEGFQSGADIVLKSLKEYLTSYSNVETRKVFINGYSRSAAIGEIVSLSSIDENLVKEENLYGYFFETPQGVDAANEKEYKSIFNIINSGDIVTHVAPTAYGLKRVGTDIDLYNENTDEIVKAFNAKIELKTFVPTPEFYKNEAELVEYILKALTYQKTMNDDPDFHDLSTRENYEQYYQEAISYIISLAFTLKQETIDDIKAAFDAMGFIDKISLLDKDGIYNFLKPILDKNEQEYDDELLRNSLNRILNVVYIAPDILALAMQEEARNSVMRCAQLHSPEVIFPLLLEYFKNSSAQN